MLIVFIAASLLFLSHGKTWAQSTPTQTGGTVPDWLEPRGLSVVDLVGFVPETDLQGAIIAFKADAGIAQYIEGQRYRGSSHCKGKFLATLPAEFGFTDHLSG